MEIIIISSLIIIYFLPSIIAAYRRCKRTTGIFILNFFLGISILGWIGALIWAVSDNTKPKEEQNA